jgi:putative addiction module component (TIGR02574 family)
MKTKQLLQHAMNLEPNERFFLLEGIIKSLDKPDAQLDAVWAEEAEKRLEAYRQGALKTVPFDEVFKDE